MYLRYTLFYGRIRFVSGSVGMADELDSGSSEGFLVWVQIPSSALKKEYQFSLQLILLFNLLVQSFFVSPFKTILLIFQFTFLVVRPPYVLFFCFLSLLFFSYCHYNTIFLFVNTFLKIIFKLSDILHIVLQTSNFSTFILFFFILPLLLLQGFSAYLHQILYLMTHSMPTTVMLQLMGIP